MVLNFLLQFTGMTKQLRRENPYLHLTVVSLILLLYSSAYWTDAAPVATDNQKTESDGSGSTGGQKGEMFKKALDTVTNLFGSEEGSETYDNAIDVVASNINKASEKSEALINKHMSAVDKDPGALITKNAMQDILHGSAFLPQKSGTRSIMLESEQGFNGVSSYQPASWKVTESVSDAVERKEESSAQKELVVTYPFGMGPALLNGCTTMTYVRTSPCYNSTQVNEETSICRDMLDSANYMGVGFDGRGFYRSESRKASIIQRSCTKEAKFLEKDVPDTMNVYGIFDTSAETKSFQSVDEYMKYIRNKAGLSNQKSLFTGEASKFGDATAFGVNLGGIGAIAGAAAGAVVGGPVGAAMGGALGGAIGGSIGAGYGSGSGGGSSSDKAERSSKVEGTGQAKTEQGASRKFFAMMYVNVILYEITLDEVKPTDISFAALTDYMSLPVSYFIAGADMRYQNFLLRWGTHYIRSAKFGGQLKITKTSKLDKFSSQQEFASFAETEFQSMFATLQSKYSQQSANVGILGIGGEHKKRSQSTSAKSEASNQGKSNEENAKSQNNRQSEFTQTSVEAQGGMPEIAEALVDFYTPAFRQLFHEWLASIKDYPKPFEFQLKPINEMFNLNMDSLFPSGTMSFGCVGGDSGNVPILVDPITHGRYYLDPRASFENGSTVETHVKVDCKYSSLYEFKEDLHKRMISLEKAVAVYMAEGPIPTSSFDLQGGQAGCEEATIAQVFVSKRSQKPLLYDELRRKPFFIEFDMPEAVPEIITIQAKYKMIFKFNRWFAVEPEEEEMHLFEGCQVANVKETDAKICIRNIILSYEESTGLFHVEKSDFVKSKNRIPSLPDWLAGSTVARSRKIDAGSKSGLSIPCNVKWSNSHRLDPTKTENCIHFTAASEGDLFVIFAAIPRDHTTWYYLKISPDGVAFYHAMLLQKRDVKDGIGILGHINLFRSFFVCVTQKSNNVLLQYGKADPGSEVGTVYSSYTFPPAEHFSKLTFYSFGAGTKSVSLMDVRLTMQMPEMNCSGNDYVKEDGRCIILCHEECNGCRHPSDNTACHECKHLAVVEINSEADRVKTCMSQCPPGRYISESDDKLCVPCSAGSFKKTEGNEICTQCPEGTNSPEGANECAQCPAGTRAKPGSKNCVDCLAGTFATAGSSECFPCSAGHFSEDGQGKCSVCSTGHYSDSGMSKCQPCPIMTFADKTGMALCNRCPSGYRSTDDRVTCEACPIGHTSGDSGCVRCPAGTYARSGDPSCMNCSEDNVASDGKPCYLTTVEISDCEEITGFYSNANEGHFVCQNVLKGFEKPFISNTDGKKEVSFTFSHPSSLRQVEFYYRWREKPGVGVNNFLGIGLKAEGYRDQVKKEPHTWDCGMVSRVDSYFGKANLLCDSGEDGYVEKLIFYRNTGSYISISYIKALTD